MSIEYSHLIFKPRKISRPQNNQDLENTKSGNEGTGRFKTAKASLGSMVIKAGTLWRGRGLCVLRDLLLKLSAHLYSGGLVRE